MKGAPGLIVALLLGVLGMALNFLYLRSKAATVESLTFVGVREGIGIKAGDVFGESMFDQVRIPRVHAGNLVNYIYQWKELPLVIGTRAARDYRERELLSRSEVRTPPAELKLTRGKLLVWVGVDTSSFVPDLVNPGDLVSFVISAPKTAPTAALQPVPEGTADSERPAVVRDPQGESTRLGPFEVAAIGNRIAAYDLARANQLGASGGNVIGIYAPYSGDDDNPILDPKATQLLDLLRKYSNTRAGVILHPRRERN